MKKWFFLLLIMTASFSACHESWLLTREQADHIIFGRYYGECMGDECVQIFKLTDKNLYKDQINKYPGKGPYVWKKMTDKTFRIAEDLPDYFPDEFTHAPQTYGCPDCADQGGIVFIISDASITKIWSLDQDRNQIPDAFHRFMERINEVIDQIK
jgi:hypothetical protein